jgi:hypothetical protein
MELTEEQRRYLRQLLSDRWRDLDQQRNLAPPGSPQEQGLLEDQLMVESIQESVTQSRHS